MLTRDQVIPRLVGDIASGRAEDSILFHKKNHIVNFFVKKAKKHHAAAGDSAIHRVKCPV